MHTTEYLHEGDLVAETLNPKPLRLKPEPHPYTAAYLHERDLIGRYVDNARIENYVHPRVLEVGYRHVLHALVKSLEEALSALQQLGSHKRRELRVISSGRGV